MSVVVQLRKRVDARPAATLVLIDLQQAHLEASGGIPRARAASALFHCREALNHARTTGVPVAFTRRFLDAASPQAKARGLSRWIEGFEPSGADMVFERERASCYDSAYFAEVMQHSGGALVIAGFLGPTACLATAIEAHHRGHRFIYLVDASASCGLDGVAGDEVHRMTTRFIGLYGETARTQDWVRAGATADQAEWRG